MPCLPCERSVGNTDEWDAHGWEWNGMGESAKEFVVQNDRGAAINQGE